MPALPPIACVVGMHRSGTTFLARQLVRAGWAVPGTPMPGSSRSNPQGHLEPLEVVALHDQMLAERGAGWRALAPLDWDADALANAARWLHALLSTLERDAPAPATAWVVKDPRTCRLLPVWRRLAEEGVPITFLRLLRDPDHVAESLYRRDAMPRALGRLLWARYTLDMLRDATPADDLLCIDTADAAAVARFLERATGRDFPDVEPVRARPLATPSGALAEAYRRFLADRDRAAFQAALEDEMRFLERNREFAQMFDEHTAPLE